MGAPATGRAVERAVDVEEARIRVSAVSRAAETVEYGLRAGCRDRENRSIEVCAVDLLEDRRGHETPLCRR